MISKKQTPKSDSKGITTGQVEHMAKLARINLTKEEKERFTKELSSILDYIDKLNEIDTSSLETMGQITGLENVMREDEPKAKKSQQLRDRQEVRDKILKEAPDKKGDHIKVPKILE